MDPSTGTGTATFAAASSSWPHPLNATTATGYQDLSTAFAWLHSSQPHALPESSAPASAPPEMTSEELEELLASPPPIDDTPADITNTGQRLAALLIDQALHKSCQAIAVSAGATSTTAAQCDIELNKYFILTAAVAQLQSAAASALCAVWSMPNQGVPALSAASSVTATAATTMATFSALAGPASPTGPTSTIVPTAPTASSLLLTPETSETIAAAPHSSDTARPRLTSAWVPADVEVLSEANVKDKDNTYPCRFEAKKTQGCGSMIKWNLYAQNKDFKRVPRDSEEQSPGATAGQGKKGAMYHKFMLNLPVQVQVAHNPQEAQQSSSPHRAFKLHYDALLFKHTPERSDMTDQDLFAAYLDGTSGDWLVSKCRGIVDLTEMFATLPLHELYGVCRKSYRLVILLGGVLVSGIPKKLQLYSYKTHGRHTKKSIASASTDSTPVFNAGTGSQAMKKSKKRKNAAQADSADKDTETKRSKNA